MKKTQSKKPIIKPKRGGQSPALVELQRQPESMPETLTSHGEPHARFQEVLQELAQARIDKKKKLAKKRDEKDNKSKVPS